MIEPSTVLLYGPPLAGKSTILHALALARSLETESFEIKPPGQDFSERGHCVRTTDAVIAATIPGAVWTMHTWDALLVEGVRILFVMDPQESRRQMNLQYAKYLRDRNRTIAAVQVTKVDIVGQAVAKQAVDQLITLYALDVLAAYSTLAVTASVHALVDSLVRGTR